MQGGFSLIGFVIWILLIAGIFGVARFMPWWPLRVLVNTVGMLLVALSLWNLVALFLSWLRRARG